jgi:hypothetical protein
MQLKVEISDANAALVEQFTAATTDDSTRVAIWSWSLR